MLTKSLAYEKWLGIKKEHQPPSLYRLLAIDALEPDSEVIANAAKSRMGFVRQFQVGENAKLAAEIVNELAQAKNVLLNLQARAAYDAQLRASSGADGAQPASGRPALAAAPDAKANRSDTATPEESAGARPIPKARRLTPAEGVPDDSRAAHAGLDIESFVSGPVSAGSSKRQQAAQEPASLSRALALAVKAVFAGCLIALLAYLVVSRWLALPGNAGSNLPSTEKQQLSASDPDHDGKANGSGNQAPAKDAKADAGPVQPRNGGPAVVATLRESKANAGSPPPYDEERLAKDVKAITESSKKVKTPDESRSVAEKAIVLADRAIVLGKADAAKAAAALTLAAARTADSLSLARRATVLWLQLQEPLSDAFRQRARKRLDEGAAESPAGWAQEAVASGPSLRDDDSAKAAASGSHDARWGKTEAQRQQIFYDLLKAVDDHGMTAEGRAAWKEIQTRNGIDDRVTLGILNEGFSTFSSWDQPDGGGRASARMNRIQWIGARTRSMTEPMLNE